MKKKTIRAHKTRKTKSKHPSLAKKLPVHIHPNGDVDNEIVNLRKSVDEQVTWYSEGDEFTIQFPVSPFANDTFVVPAGGSVSSGRLKADAALDFMIWF